MRFIHKWYKASVMQAEAGRSSRTFRHGVIDPGRDCPISAQVKMLHEQVSSSRERSYTGILTTQLCVKREMRTELDLGWNPDDVNGEELTCSATTIIMIAPEAMTTQKKMEVGKDLA
jgi:hypothetical protein